MKSSPHPLPDPIAFHFMFWTFSPRGRKKKEKRIKTSRAGCYYLFFFWYEMDGFYDGETYIQVNVIESYINNVSNL